MVDGIFELYAQRPRHCFRTAEPIANVKCLDLTPFFPFCPGASRTAIRQADSDFWACHEPEFGYAAHSLMCSGLRQDRNPVAKLQDVHVHRGACSDKDFDAYFDSS